MAHKNKQSISINVFNTRKRCKKLKLGWIYPTHFKHLQQNLTIWFLADFWSFFEFPDIKFDVWKYKEKIKTLTPTQNRGPLRWPLNIQTLAEKSDRTFYGI